MKHTDFEYRLDCALGLITETNRRDFLKTVGRAGAGLATGGSPASILTKGLVGGAVSGDPFADIPDNELITMPEREWMNVIPSTRLSRILGREDYDVGGEIVSKLVRIMGYGLKLMAADKSFEIMKDAMERNGIDPRRSLFKALTGNGDRQIFDYVAPNRASRSASDAINALEKVGIDVPDHIKKATFENAKRAVDLQQKEIEEWRKKYEEIDKQNKKDNDLKYNTARMHQPFESRLEKALMSVIG